MKRILVGGIGNIFLGDDGFGVEVARRLAARPWPEGVRVRDFGIRGLDLVYALLDPHDAVVLVDAVSRGGAPGTLYLLEPEIPEQGVSLEAHGMDPVKVLALARSLGGAAAPTYLVLCDIAPPAADLDEEMRMGLGSGVAAAVDPAVEMIETLVARLVAAEEAVVAAA